ncbi:MAG: M14 family metallopeptidase [Symbiobacteriaceae bacterium]|nr:M14 family metallopeptidase [Symbiobacteriaceae bacterium]
MENFTIGTLSAARGTKLQDWLPVLNSRDKLPVTLINGASPGKTAVITAGIHGGEYPGIEAAIRLSKAIDAGEVHGRIALVHCVNQEAFFSKSQYYNPLDGQNLNRVFPGKALGTLSERLAYTLSSLFFTQADYYLDLHSGDIHENLTDFVLYPLLGSEEQIATSRHLAALLDVPYVVGSSSNTGTFGSAAEMGVPGLLGEIGCCGRWNEIQVEAYISGIRNILYYTGILEGEPRDVNPTFFKRMVGVSAGATGLWYPWVEPDQPVSEGQPIGEIRDLFGTVTEKYLAPTSGVMLYVVSSLSVKLGEPLAAVGEPE